MEAHMKRNPSTRQAPAELPANSQPHIPHSPSANLVNAPSPSAPADIAWTKDGQVLPNSYLETK